MHKRNFVLTSGECLNDDSYRILAFDVKVEGDDLLVLLPEAEALDAVIGTSRWMIKQATAELIDRSAESGIEIVGPAQEVGEASGCGTGEGAAGCGNSTLEW